MSYYFGLILMKRNFNARCGKLNNVHNLFIRGIVAYCYGVFFLIHSEHVVDISAEEKEEEESARIS